MRLIPVIDLAGGTVVHAVGGNRSQYRPLESALVAGSDPPSVAEAFAAGGFAEVYIADLDAIAGAEPGLRIFEQIASAGLKLMIDAGTGDREKLESLIAALGPVEANLVVGSETLTSPDLLSAAVGQYQASRIIFSLDLRRGDPIICCPAWQGLSADEIINDAVRLGIRRVIVLDLARVGRQDGPAGVELCRRVRARHPELELIAGGGVRNANDLAELAAAGCDAALVATALHRGQLQALGGNA